MHTNEIGAAIEVALDLGGRPKSIRVTDLFEEVDEEHERREAELAATALAAPVADELPAVTTAVVAVCCGSGLVELFAQLGVQGVVTGGQTMNPSTAELLETVQRVNADQVVVLPNNNNIIAVAEQLDALTEKTVIVVPTRSMPEALAALVGYDADATAVVNVTEMTEAAGSVVTGEVTRAVRDSTSGAGAIVEGDWIGLVRGDRIVAVASSARGGRNGAARRDRRRIGRTGDDGDRARRRRRWSPIRSSGGSATTVATSTSTCTTAANRSTPTSSESSERTVVP